MTGKSDMHMAEVEKMSDVGGTLQADRCVWPVTNLYKFKEERQPRNGMSRNR
jgi:hypothetical protein